jgi:hypothetical protein
MLANPGAFRLFRRSGDRARVGPLRHLNLVPGAAKVQPARSP